jgi:hypothetical protein
MFSVCPAVGVGSVTSHISSTWPSRTRTRLFVTHTILHMTIYLHLIFLLITLSYIECKAKILNLLTIFSLNLTLHVTQMSSHVV